MNAVQRDPAWTGDFETGPDQDEHALGFGLDPAAIDQPGADLVVGDVQVGTRLVDRGRVEAETQGMFVLVRARLEVPGPRRVSLNGVHLITGDRTYNQWSSNTLRADPGFAQEEDLVFEVDPAQIDDLSLEIWAAATVQGFYQRGRVHLGITADNADQWRQAAEGRELQPAKRVPRRPCRDRRAPPAGRCCGADRGGTWATVAAPGCEPPARCWSWPST